jgi:hypothetical protein
VPLPELLRRRADVNDDVRIEWGVKWIDAENDAERYEGCADEAAARRIAKQYGTARVVRREVWRRAWKEAE